MSKRYVLDDELFEKCLKSAEEGYHIAEGSLELLKSTMEKYREGLKKEAASYDQDKNSKIAAKDDIDKMLLELKVFAEDRIKKIQDDIAIRKKDMSTFSITLFGRTMAGKSTLMEILTNGDGSSIGKGTMRTTQDVREYSWNGLKIVDVPGAGAFEGEDDERKAYAAAAKSDLIIFLLTDDKPDRAEADCLEKVRKMGKSVIGLLNVKVSEFRRKRDDSGNIVEATMAPERWVKKIKERLASDDVKATIKQFYELGEKREQDWSDIEFIQVHLKCEYAAQKESNKSIASLYQACSNFNEVKKHITDYVNAKGEISRFKTFFDIVETPVYELLNSFEDNKNRMEAHFKNTEHLIQQIKNNKKLFLDQLENGSNIVIKNIKSKLDADFIEIEQKNYESDREELKRLISRKIDKINIEENFKKYIYRNNQKFNNILKKLETDFKKATRDIGTINKDIDVGNGGGIFDYSKVFLVLKTAVMVSGWFGKTNPWVSIGNLFALRLIDVVQEFIPSKEEQIKERKASLKKELDGISAQFISEVEQKLKLYYDECVKHWDRCIKFVRINGAVINSAHEEQENFYNNVRKILDELNLILVNKIITNIKIPVNKIDRQIGSQLTIYTNSNVNVPDDVVVKLRSYMQEKVIIKQI